MRLAIGLVLLLAPAASFGADRVWLKAETADAVVYSDTSRGDLEDFAVRYAGFREGFNLLLAPEGRRAPASTILLFRKASTLQGYVSNERRKADENLNSFTTTVDLSSLMAVALSGDVDQAITTTFEFDAGSMLPRLGYIVPLWMRQGTGEVLASLYVRKGKVIIGERQDRFTDTLNRNSWLAWDRFFDLDQSSPEYNGKNGNFTGVYQAQAWALMHTVLLDGDDSRGRFQKLAAQVTGTKADQAIVARFLGVGPTRISDPVRRDVARGRTREFPIDAAKLKAALRIGPAPEAELRVQLGDLLVSAGNPLEAQVQYDRARALAPDSAIVKEAWARLDLARGDASAAAQDYRDAVAAGSTNARSYLSSARDRLNDNSTGGRDHPGGGGDSVALAVTEIRRAMVLAPGNGEAYQLLGRAYFLSPQLTPENAEELTPALADPDQGKVIRYYRALLYSRLGQEDKSEADLKFILADRNTPNGLREAALGKLESTAFAADQLKVEAFVKARNFDAALAVVAAARQRGVQTTDRSYEQLKGWIDDNVTVARLNQLFADKKWAELREASGAILRDNPTGRLAGAARKIRAAANQALHPRKPAADDSEAPQLLSTNGGGDDPPAPSGGTLHLHVFAGSRHWEDFHDYLDQVAAQVMAEWTNEKKDPAGSVFAGKVSVTFTLSASGDVARIDRVNSAAGIAAAVGATCSGVLKAAAPFPHWSDDMTAVLGQEQHLLIAFSME